MLTFFRVAFRAMACENELQFYARDFAHAKQASSLAISEVRRIEQKYSRYRPDSVITCINLAAGKSHVGIDKETWHLLRLADGCHKASGGLFDITSGVLRRAWDFRTARIPEPEAVRALLPLVDWCSVVWNERQIYLPRVGMEIDFGGIGKEYAADRVGQLLESAGVTHGLVNLGGDIRIVGPHPNDAPWAVHVAHPRFSGEIAHTFHMTTGAFTTSGDYQRYILAPDGRRFCHVINPTTGWPVSHWQSVSVIAPLCSVAGSASTIAMLMEEDGARYLRHCEMPFLLINRNGERFVSS